MTHEQYLENAKDFLRKHMVSGHGYSDALDHMKFTEKEVSAAHRYEHTHISQDHRHTD